MERSWRLRGRTLVAISALLALVCALAVEMPPVRAAPGYDASPADRVLVVTVNLEEAYHKADLARTADMDRFVARLSKLPYDPDVLLLQEVRHHSAAFVARKLRERTGARYVISVDPGARPATIKRHRSIHHETAILLNADTMRAQGPGGYIASAYKRSQGARGKNPTIHNQALLLAREIDGGLTIPLASVHLNPPSTLASARVSDNLRKKWAVQVAEALKKRYGSAGALPTIGGDFNSGRCAGPATPCRSAGFWGALTGRFWGYRDSVHDVAPHGGVDYVFTRGGVHRVGVDMLNKPSASYSDHKFRWAIIGGDTKPPSRPENARATQQDTDVRLSWDASTEAGGGGVMYEVWRAGRAMDFRLMRVVSTAQFTDRTTFRTKSYTYYVRAIDDAHNSSARSNSQTITLHL